MLPSAQQLIELLDGMNKKFANRYVIFYPTVSRDNLPFPVNQVAASISRSLMHGEAI